MTDAEIIKALECCSTGIFVCDTEACPLKDSVPDTIAACRFELVILALDLINRLQADKEALIAGQETLQKALAEKNAEIEELKTVFDYDFSKFESEYDSKIKAEAIKEFAKRLKSDMSYSYLLGREFCTGITIDNLVKEMAGDAE